MRMNVFNRSYTNNLVGTIYIPGGNIDFSIGPRSSFYKPFGTDSKETRIFAAFNAPSDCIGDISCIAH